MYHVSCYIYHKSNVPKEFFLCHRRKSPSAKSRGEPVGEVSPQSAAAAPGHAVAEGHGAMGPWISGEIMGVLVENHHF